jgi:capsule polysaccharide export protein KpsE/RkpR
MDRKHKVLDKMLSKVRVVMLKKAEDAVNKAYKQKRLVFKSDGQIDYTDKSGKKETYSDADLAALLWDKLNNEVMAFQNIANLAMIDITPDDIKAILLKLKEGGK